MTEHNWRPWAHVPVHQVAAANATGAHLDDDLAWAGVRPLDLVDLHAVRGVVNDGLQDAITSSADSRADAIESTNGGRSTPASVMKPAIRFQGVMSNAGFQA